MTENDIIQRGEEAKYQVKILREEFDMASHVYEVTLHYGMLGRSLTIYKDGLLFDEEGHCFAVFDTTDMLGLVTAETRYYVPDSDYPDGYRTEVDRQHICRVVENPACPVCCDAIATATDDLDPIHPPHVIWTRIFRSDANSLYATLVDRDGIPFATADGDIVKVHKIESEINH